MNKTEYKYYVLKDGNVTTEIARYDPDWYNNALAHSKIQIYVDGKWSRSSVTIKRFEELKKIISEDSSQRHRLVELTKEEVFLELV